MKIEITFTEPLLGTLAGAKKPAEDFIASKNPNGIAQDEMEIIEDMDEALQNASTVFPKEDGKPFLWDYQIKGFFKEACKAMIDMGCFTQEDLKKLNLTNYTYKRTIDNLLFVKPRKCFINLSGEVTFCERPLRGQTMRGERISLARSEQIPAGSTVECEIITMSKHLEKVLPQWLTYGELKGLGQWRNSGMGRFSYKSIG